MSLDLELLIWELPKQGQGVGSQIATQDDALAELMDDLIPDCDLGKLASDEEAIRLPDGHYLLTIEGFARFLRTAQQKGDPNVAAILQEKQMLYWFRPYNEWLGQSERLQEIADSL